MRNPSKLTGPTFVLLVGGSLLEGSAAGRCFVAFSSALLQEFVTVLPSEVTFMSDLRQDLDLGLISGFGARMMPGLSFDAGLRLEMCVILGSDG